MLLHVIIIIIIISLLPCLVDLEQVSYAKSFLVVLLIFSIFRYRDICYRESKKKRAASIDLLHTICGLWPRNHSAISMT